MLRTTIITTLFTLALAGPAYAGSVLFTDIASPGGGTITCRLVNAGKKAIPSVFILAVQANFNEAGGGGPGKICADLPPNAVCFVAAAPVESYCKFTLDGASPRKVRASLSVDAADGTTVLSLPARK